MRCDFNENKICIGNVPCDVCERLGGYEMIKEENFKCTRCGNEDWTYIRNEDGVCDICEEKEKEEK